MASPQLENGFFKINRQIFNSDIWIKPFELRFFIYLIGRARWKTEPIRKYQNYGFMIKKGQYLRSFRKLQTDLEYRANNQLIEPSLSRIKTAIKRLENQDRITTETTPLGTLFTVVNYLKYQDLQSNNPEAENTPRTPPEHPENNKERRIKKEKLNTQIEKIYNHWLKKCADINKARLTKRLKKRIQTKLKKWKVDKIITAIDHYSEIYQSDWYYSHNFTLFKFIKQGNGAPRFVSGLDQEYAGDLWKDYQQQQKGNSKKTFTHQELYDLGIESEKINETNFRFNPKTSKYYPTTKGKSIINEALND